MFTCSRTKHSFNRWTKACPACGRADCLVPDYTQFQLQLHSGEEKDRKSYKIETISTGFPGCDCLLGGGFESGDFVAQAADPSAGKTSFSMKMASNMVKANFRVLYVMTEMKPSIVSAYETRLGMTESRPTYLFSSNLRDLEDSIQTTQPHVVIVDSLQELYLGVPGQINNYVMKAVVSRLRGLSKDLGVVIFCIARTTKAFDIEGPKSTRYAVDEIFTLQKGHNGECVLSHVKSRRGGAGGATFAFRNDEHGVYGIEDRETGHLMRHDAAFKTGVAATPTIIRGIPQVDEVTAVTSGGKGIALVSAPSSVGRYLTAVITKCFPTIPVKCVVRASRAPGIDDAMDLAVVMASISCAMNVPLPVDVAYMGRLDADGRLLSITGSKEREVRATSQGYRLVIGPRRVGSQVPNWAEADTLADVLSLLNISVPAHTEEPDDNLG